MTLPSVSNSKGIRSRSETKRIALCLSPPSALQTPSSALRARQPGPRGTTPRILRFGAGLQRRRLRSSLSAEATGSRRPEPPTRRTTNLPTVCSKRTHRRGSAHPEIGAFEISLSDKATRAPLYCGYHLPVEILPKTRAAKNDEQREAQDAGPDRVSYPGCHCLT